MIKALSLPMQHCMLVALLDGVLGLFLSLVLFASNKSGSASRTESIQEHPDFLHVGLHTTCTTFLQQSLCENADFTEPLFLENNFVYLGTCGGARNKPEFVVHGSHLTAHTGGYNDLVENGSVPEPKEEFIFDKRQAK